MADESNVDAVAGGTETDTAAPAPIVKKARKPRQAKTLSESAPSAEVIASEPVKKTRAKRGSKIAAIKAVKPIGRPKAQKTAGAATAETAMAKTAASMEALDDIASLMQLEEENKSLRRQLSDKLRAENADLRKRLG
jgi:hypothetical protein